VSKTVKLPRHATMHDDPVSAIHARLENQLAWYDHRALVMHHWYNGLKVLELVAAVTLPVVAGLDGPRVVTASIAAVVALLVGVQHLFQFHSKWISYRSIAETLQHERALYLAHAGPYRIGARDRLLAETVESLVSQEHARWANTETAADPTDDPPSPAAAPPVGDTQVAPA